jgi:hypothetical protein
VRAKYLILYLTLTLQLPIPNLVGYRKVATYVREVANVEAVTEFVVIPRCGDAGMKGFARLMCWRTGTRLELQDEW